jgi:nucleoside-diphosphate-sugar epimerase
MGDVGDDAYVAVIGGAGRLGSYIVRELAADHDLRIIDKQVPVGHPDAIQADILDLTSIREAITGVDAIIHVAGVDAHVQAAPETFFETNVMGTWNVLQAAAEHDVRDVIICSSSSANGLNATNRDVPPDYLPIDEAHPSIPNEAYGLGKQINEICAASFGRRPGANIICIRPTYIAFPETVPNLASQLPVRIDGRSKTAFSEPPPLLRTYVAPDDLARCFRLALEAGLGGFHLFFASASDTFEPTPTLEYLERIYGRLPPVRDHERYRRDERASPVDCTRARTTLGWIPDHDWPALLRSQGLDVQQWSSTRRPDPISLNGTTDSGLHA